MPPDDLNCVLIIQQLPLVVSSCFMEKFTFFVCFCLFEKWPKRLGLVSVPVKLLLIFAQENAKVTLKKKKCNVFFSLEIEFWFRWWWGGPGSLSVQEFSLWGNHGCL